MLDLGAGPLANIHSKIKEIDPVWGKIRVEAEEAVQTEPLLGALFHKNVLQHDTIDMVCPQYPPYTPDQVRERAV